MRVLHIVAADRWTGAAATALQLVEALRGAGVDCRFVYRGGRGLEARLSGCEWARAAIAKVDSPASFVRSVRAVRREARGCDVVHVHLPQDHVLARAAGVRAPVRSIHHPGHLDSHLYYRWLLDGVKALALANSAMAATVARSRLARVPRRVLPVALEARFRPSGNGPGVRERLGVPADAVLVGTIGKLDEDRGHDTFLEALADAPGTWGMVIGKGPRVPYLRHRAEELGIARRVVWPGYVEEGLESLYAAMDLFVFPAAGSDWAHRAIAETAGCGVPVLSADLPGTVDLISTGTTGDLFPAGDAAALAALIRSWAADPEKRRIGGRESASRAARDWTPERLADVCLELYRACGAAPPSAVA